MKAAYRGEQVKLSVAMITYNHEKFIAKSIESVLMQKTNFQYEIVVGEDCSTDRTREIIMDFQKKYPDKIRLLLAERNRGNMRNYTETIMACKGKYIAYLDGDDFWTEPNKLKRQVEFLDYHPECSSCFHSVRRIYEDGSYDFFYPFGKKETYTLEDVLLNFSFIHVSSLIFRRGLFGEFPPWFFFGNIKIDDWTLYVLNAQYGLIGYIDEIMAIYRKHKSGLWSSMGPIGQILWDVETRDSVNTHLGFRDENKKKRSFFTQYLRLAKKYEQAGDHKRARKYLMKCISNLPFKPAYSSRYLFTAILRLYFPWLVPHLLSLKSKFMNYKFFILV